MRLALAVTLTGSGWQPGESVHINVNDTWAKLDAQRRRDRRRRVVTSRTGSTSELVRLRLRGDSYGRQSGMATTTPTERQGPSLTV